jgi:hypothetical protein
MLALHVMFYYKIPNVAVKWLTLLYIQEVLSSNLNLKIGYPAEFFVAFRHPFRKIPG